MDETTVDYVPKWLKIIGKTVKWIFISLFVAIILWLILRSIWQRGPSSVRRYYMTQSAYDLSDGRPHVYERNVYNTTELEKPFHASRVYTTRETSGLQISVYFNVNTDKTVDPEKFEFRLVPAGGEISLLPVAVDASKVVMYRHYRVVFEGIDFSADEQILEIYYDGVRYDSITAYLNDGYEREISLSGSERKIQNEAH